MNDNLEYMICDIGLDYFNKAHVDDTLQSEMEESLFLGCINFTRLLVVVRLFNFKEKGGWTDRSFIEFLELLQEMLQEGNTLFNRSYDAKKICV